MNTHSNSQYVAPRNVHRISTRAAVVRSVFALAVCVLAWLCIRTALATERAGRILWQHPRLLLAFAVVIAAAAVGYMIFSKIHRRAVLVAGVVVAALLVQWLVVTPAVGDSMMQMMQRAAREVSQ